MTATISSSSQFTNVSY